MSFSRVIILPDGYHRKRVIDIDTDAHNVVSLTGDEDAPREYMMATGMLGSFYEGVIWEQFTGEECVSTISVLLTATKNDIELLVIGKTNLTCEIEKLDVSETIRKEIVNAVNSGMIVTIPKESITMGNWNGTGYIITNPETGTGAYRITGGLNGGSTPTTIDDAYILGMVAAGTIITSQFQSMVGSVELLCQGLFCGSDLLMAYGAANIIASVSTIISMMNAMTLWTEMYYNYVLSGDDEKGLDLLEDMAQTLNKQSKNDIFSSWWELVFFRLKGYI